MDFLVRQWCIRRTRKSIVRLNQQAVDEFRYQKMLQSVGPSGYRAFALPA
ncbi:hypothetical protein Rcae01_02974 [Novipirellula caenicola]|uniref:Uncharacterized protein n=1 Tax=Novipirellula caenicola TaxID=1536901 RepID=A0ABP9VVG4_9BACT